MCSLAAYQPYYLTVVPPLVTMLALHPAVTAAHLASTRVVSSGGAPISSSILDKLRGKIRPDCEIKEGYGMTECPILTRTKKSQEPSKEIGSRNLEMRIKSPCLISIQELVS